MVSSIGVDLTACWRPRAGMVTLAVHLTDRMLAAPGAERRFTLFCSRERPAGLASAEGTRAVLSPHRHEVLNKLRWLPAVEGDAGLDAMLYPYWPCPPRRRPEAPPAAMVVHDLAFRTRPREVPWQQRVYMGAVMPGALRAARCVLTP